MENDLIQSVIRVVANYGMENTTIKKIAAEAKVTASSIYAYYIDKEDLLEATFLWADEYIASNIRRLFRLRQPDDSLRKIWKRCFRFLVEHRDETLFYIRFRYSTMYTDELRMQHHANFGKISASLLDSFCGDPAGPGSRKQFLFDHVVNSTLFYAEKFITGKIPSSETCIEQIWNTVCVVVQSCFETEPDSVLHLRAGMLA